MSFTVRLYANHDPDLIALSKAGFSVKKMLQDAFIAFANSKPFHILIDEDVPLIEEPSETCRVYKLYFSKKELNVIRLLSKIVNRKKNVFCKMVLRNAFIQQNLRSLIVDSSLENLFLSDLNAKHIPSEGTVLLSSYRLEQTVEFAGKKYTKPKETYNHIEIPIDLVKPRNEYKNVTYKSEDSKPIITTTAPIVIEEKETNYINEDKYKETIREDVIKNTIVEFTAKPVSTSNKTSKNSLIGMMSKICNDD